MSDAGDPTLGRVPDVAAEPRRWRRTRPALGIAPLRRLLATGYRDAGDVRGAGLIPTWPADGRRVPGVTIDHVLADRRVGILDYGVYTVPGTDHRAVYAELALPEAPTTVGYPSQGVSKR